MVSFRSYEWEGKGLKYYIKDTIRNRPPMIFTVFIYLSVFPVGMYYLWKKEQAEDTFSRFRTQYIVYRDDDPRVRNILRYDENGNRIYLEPKQK